MLVEQVPEKIVGLLMERAGIGHDARFCRDRRGEAEDEESQFPRKE